MRCDDSKRTCLPPFQSIESRDSHRLVDYLPQTMFTGIVEHIGTVLAVSGNGSAITLGTAAAVFSDVKPGDQLSVNGK